MQDLPHGVHMAMYTPSLRKRLGQEFARRYYKDYRVVIEKLRSDNLLEALCAFDVLEEVAWVYYDQSALPENLKTLPDPIPKQAAKEITQCGRFSEFKGNSVGEFLPFLLENG